MKRGPATFLLVLGEECKRDLQGLLFFDRMDY
nr:MAG TPA: hypothetical protein [Caudoviricetes sp.]